MLTQEPRRGDPLVRAGDRRGPGLRTRVYRARRYLRGARLSRRAGVEGSARGGGSEARARARHRSPSPHVARLVTFIYDWDWKAATAISPGDRVKPKDASAGVVCVAASRDWSSEKGWPRRARGGLDRFVIDRRVRLLYYYAAARPAIGNSTARLREPCVGGVAHDLGRAAVCRRPPADADRSSARRCRLPIMRGRWPRWHARGGSVTHRLGAHSSAHYARARGSVRVSVDFVRCFIAWRDRRGVEGLEVTRGTPRVEATSLFSRPHGMAGDPRFRESCIGGSIDAIFFSTRRRGGAESGEQL